MTGFIPRRCTNKTRVPDANLANFSADIQIQCIRDANGHDYHQSFLLDKIIQWEDEPWPA